jgi:hypothetical protein
LPDGGLDAGVEPGAAGTARGDQVGGCMDWGRLLCRVGRHKRRVVRWEERGPVKTPSGVLLPYMHKLSGYRCLRCEPVEDVTNDPIIMPSALVQSRSIDAGHRNG